MQRRCGLMSNYFDHLLPLPYILSDIAVFVPKRDIKLQPTNRYHTIISCLFQRAYLLSRLTPVMDDAIKCITSFWTAALAHPKISTWCLYTQLRGVLKAYKGIYTFKRRTSGTTGYACSVVKFIPPEMKSLVRH